MFVPKTEQSNKVKAERSCFISEQTFVFFNIKKSLEKTALNSNQKIMKKKRFITLLIHRCVI